MKSKAVFVLVLTLALLVSGCRPVATSVPTQPPAASAAPAPTDTPEPEAIELTVFAAASLTDAFNVIRVDFEALHPHVTVVYNFAASNALAQQINEGAPADVFASANNTQMNVAIDGGRIVTGAQHTFARNRLVVVVPTGNPGQVETLQDLAKPGLLVVLAAAEVPVGKYSLDFLDKAKHDPAFGAGFKDAVLDNVVSFEENVRSVLTKITLGEGDAGIVYTSDITGEAAGQVERLDIPDALNTIASYPIAPVEDSAHPEMAQTFVDYIRAPEGQLVLAEFGFTPATGDVTGAAPGAVPVEVTGLVDNPTTFTAGDLRAFEQITVRAGGETFTGVLLSTILETVGMQATAQSVVFTGGDGYTQELTLDEINADPQAIIAIEEGGVEERRDPIAGGRPRWA